MIGFRWTSRQRIEWLTRVASQATADLARAQQEIKRLRDELANEQSVSTRIAIERDQLEDKLVDRTNALSELAERWRGVPF